MRRDRQGAQQATSRLPVRDPGVDGEWSFDRILDGSTIQDVWVGYQDGRAPGRRHMGTTLRSFDAKHDEWRVIFIVPASGKIIMLHGSATGERIVLNGVDVDGNSLCRSFNDMTPDAFVWRGETSYDSGKAWRVACGASAPAIDARSTLREKPTEKRPIPCGTHWLDGYDRRSRAAAQGQ